MWDDLPADIAFDVLIYDDREPSQVIAHLALCHRHDDPSGMVVPIEPSTAGLPQDPLFRSQLAGGNMPSLRTVLDLHHASTIGVFVRGIQFTISLEPWMSLDLDHTRVAHGIMATYRYDLFTEEQHRKVDDEARRHREHQSNRPTDA